MNIETLTEKLVARNIKKSLKLMNDIDQAHKDADTSTLRFGPSEVTFPPTRDLDPDVIREGMEKAIWEDSHCRCGAELPRRSYNYKRGQCYKCEHEAKEKAKFDWLKSQKELTIEERLGKIEEFIYWYQTTDHRDPFTIPMR